MTGPLLAEFRDPETLADGAGTGEAGAPPRAGCLHALPGRRPGRGTGRRTVPHSLLSCWPAACWSPRFAFALQWYSAVIAYPINSGGRPLNSWQVFWLVPFEVGVFAAALCGVIALLLVVRPAAPASSAVRNSRLRARDPGSLFSARRRRAERRSGARSSPCAGSRGRGRGDGGPSAMMPRPAHACSAALLLAAATTFDDAAKSLRHLHAGRVVSRRHGGAGLAGRRRRARRSRSRRSGCQAAAGRCRSFWRAARSATISIVRPATACPATATA